MSAIHPVIATAEVTVEGRLHDKVGLAGILGVGVPNGYLTEDLGVSGRWYALGTFDHGMQVGAEILYQHVSAKEDGVTATANAIAAGPFIGYKIAARFGLTFEMQLGAQYQAVGAHATDGDTSVAAKANGLVPLVNINVGWSF